MKKNFKKRGYSIAEVIVSMAVIMMLSLATVAACYVGVKIQSRAESSLLMQNYSQEIVRQFVLCGNDVQNKSDEEQKQQFILDFNSRLSFVLNSWEPNFNNFSNDKTLDNAWNIDLVLEQEGKYQETDGNVGIVQVPVVGFNVSYLGVDNGGRTYTFGWRYFTKLFELEVKVNVRGGTYYLTVLGKYADGNTNVVQLDKSI